LKQKQLQTACKYILFHSLGVATHYSFCLTAHWRIQYFDRSLLSCATLLIVQPYTEYNFVLQFFRDLII